MRSTDETGPLGPARWLRARGSDATAVLGGLMLAGVVLVHVVGAGLELLGGGS
jgi:hypothetical protein